jgi:hypothetical protein
VEPLRIASFSLLGLPILPAGNIHGAPPGGGSWEPPPGSVASAHGGALPPPAGEEVSAAAPREWQVAGEEPLGRRRDLGEGSRLGDLVAGAPDERGRRRFRFERASGEGREGFEAISARLADVDGDGVSEIILQGWSPGEE